MPDGKLQSEEEEEEEEEEGAEQTGVGLRQKWLYLPGCVFDVSLSVSVSVCESLL
jgi:hypothetical protein